MVLKFLVGLGLGCLWGPHPMPRHGQSRRHRTSLALVCCAPPDTCLLSEPRFPPQYLRVLD